MGIQHVISSTTTTISNDEAKEGAAGDSVVATATIIAPEIQHVISSTTTTTKQSATTSHKKKKAKRDPNEPKKNLTSYVLFSNYIRPIIKERMPGISFVDLSKQMGLEFRQLSFSDRQIWNEKAKEEKKRYDLAMEEYRKTGAVATSHKEPTPKKGKSSYNLYFQAMHDKMKTEHPDMSFGELSKKLGQDFKGLTAEDKKHWEDLAKEDRKRVFESNLQAASTAETLAETSKSKPASKRSRKQKRDSDAPKKNLTSYIYFSNSIREEMKQRYPEATFCELGKLMGMEFKKLSVDQRKVFDELAAKDKIRYDAAMVEYEAKKKKEKEISEAAAVVVSEIVQSKDGSEDEGHHVTAVVEC